MTSWDTFTAFGGKLNPSALQARDWQLSDDGQASACFFTEWIQGLRLSPANYGIPPNRVNDVNRLLDAFFPVPAKGDRILPTRIKSESGFPDSLRKIVPAKVGFGPSNILVPISDAPNALGYIFSVANPPSMGNPTFESYYLPLGVFYAWFLYLAFVRPSSSPTSVITNVPADACLMYLPSSFGSSRPIFFLGATWSGSDPADANAAAGKENDEAQMDLWRWSQLIQPALGLNPTAHVPDLTPSVRRVAARRLNEYILGKNKFNPTVTPFLSPLFDGILPEVPGVDDTGLREFVLGLSLLVKADAKQPLGVTVEPDLLIAHAKLGPQLMELLLAFVDSLTTVTDPTQLITKAQKLVQFYITPHVFTPINNVELPLGPQSKVILGPLALSLPGLLLPKIIQKLESLRCHLHHEYESNDDQISPKFFGESLPIARMSGLQGAKLCVRTLGQAIASDAFAQSFSSTSLDNASFQNIKGQLTQTPVLAPPNLDSRILLQQAQMRGDDSFANYSADIKAACPKTFGLWSYLKL
ncbi:hypothetical protein N7517_010846 [Penicillium concentricum]|uniref:Uncharacterized protein n=1 Tax=Penicillium concentricum TaxID=293559 RepID=A0A9W9R9M9_9EURO|nr:uncharacterized protein N7517_010846 [Penicillium concentricum]KAJ5356237.1 hypothetical protein N7517_010846 [Penicillium concentricum]